MDSYRDEKREHLIRFVRENQNSLYRLAYFYAKNAEDAMDLTQESIVKAISKVDTLRDMESVKNWVYRILVNECLMFLRKNKKILYLEEEVEDIVDEGQRIETDRLDLLKALERLNDKQKTVVVLRYFEDMKLEDIALVTKTNLSTVKSRLYKSLELMKEWLQQDI